MYTRQRVRTDPARYSRRCLTLAFSISLWAGCGDGAAGWLGEDAIIKGKVQNWTRGGGSVIEYLPDASSMVLGRVPLGEDGSFTATLPREVRTAPVSKHFGSAGGCTQTKEVTPPDLALTQLIFYVTEPNNVSNFRLWQTTGAITGDPIGAINVLYYYASTDGSITGKDECPTPDRMPNVNTFDVHLRKGWNSILLTYLSLGRAETPISIDVRTARPPADAAWWAVTVH